MAEVTGRTPGETKPRVIEIKKVGNDVSIWLHPPNSSEQSGWQALVNIKDFLAALAEEGISI
jgi:hypothetical protein